MKKIQRILWVTTVGLTLMLVACVTINIYFPAEKVESVAGEIVDEIRSNQPTNEETQSQNQQGVMQQFRFAFFPQNVWAAEATNVSNPTIRSLKEKMKERFQSLSPYYERGSLEEQDDGYLSITDTEGLSLKEKRDLNVLVDAENSDRSALYSEVAKALHIDPGQMNRVAEIFAKEWQKPIR